MKIIVDADACPVKEIIVTCAKSYSLPVIMVTDTTHIIEDDYAKIIVVEKGPDSADLKIFSLIVKGDIVVTQDYGLASLCLSKGVFVIGNNGFIYNENNIDRLLFERHLSQKIRQSGGRTKSIPKRTPNDDKNFYNNFIKLIHDSFVS